MHTQQGEIIDAALLENYYGQSENYKRLESRMKNLQERAAARVDQMRNPMLAYAASPPSTPSTIGSTIGAGDLDKSTVSMGSMTEQPPPSFELEVTAGGGVSRGLRGFQRPTPVLFLAIRAAFDFIFKRPSWKDFSDSLFKRQILLHRACLALYRRFELILGSLILHILLGLLFAWVNKDVPPASVIAFLGI